MDPETRVRDLVEPVLAAEGVELVDVQLAGGSLQVFVDRPGGLDLEAISVLSRRISDALDESDPVPGRYTLEVSSPGVERPLRTPEHFQRAVGEIVKVRTQPEAEGERRVQGELMEAGPDAVLIDVAGEDAPRRLTYGEIERARTVFDWERATGAKQSSGKGSG